MLLEGDRGFCPHCEQGTAFQLVHQVRYAEPHFAGPEVGGHVDWDKEVHTGVLIYECLHCDKSIVLLQHEFPPVGDVLPDGKVWRRMVAPAQEPRQMHEAAPTAMRDLFQEASRCEHAGALRGAGVLYRAAVEEMVKDQGAAGRDLYSKIDDLKGKLSPELIEDLHEARMLGNDSIHAGLTYSPEEVADVAALIEEAVLALYVQPAEKRAMREARKQRRDQAGSQARP